jgi:hypothetical protein
MIKLILIYKIKKINKNKIIKMQKDSGLKMIKLILKKLIDGKLDFHNKILKNGLKKLLKQHN